MKARETSSEEPAAFEDATTSVGLSAVLSRNRERLASRADGMGGLELMRAYSDLTDGLIARVFSLAAEAAASEAPDACENACRQAAVVAVGGYGRREMAPYSDIDVAFLAGGADDHDVDLVIRRAFRLLMDVAEVSGLTVGYSYRRVDELRDLPLETQTALLDARLVSGSAPLFAEFCSALRVSIAPAAFVSGHVGSRVAGEPAFGTPFLVEPDIKEGHGGLRDLHAARWIAQVAFGFPADAVWEGLRSRGILSDRQIEEVGAAAEFVSRVRNALHLIAGRRLDVLGRERHTQVARRLGFRDAARFAGVYYSHALVLWRAYTVVASECLRRELAIEPGIVARDGWLRIRDRGLPRRDPAAIVRSFGYAQSYGLRIELEARELLASEALRAARAGDARETGAQAVVKSTSPLGADADRCFLELLSGPGASSALREMANTGVLQVVVPDFDELMRLTPGDRAHLYTVGEHSLRAVEELEALFAGSEEHFADVFTRIQRLEVLFLAALLHDVGKLDLRSDHSTSGSARAVAIARSLGMPADACEKVGFLVANHLVMSEVARLRDLSHKKTISDFVKIVSDSQMLDMLLLLTVADSRAVGSRNWSRVQMRFLLELHERAMAAIRAPNGQGADIDRHRTRVRRELCLANLPPEEVDEHCEAMPPEYLLNTPPEELAAHIANVRSVRAGVPAVEVRDERGRQFTQLTVVAGDRSGLLSRIAGVLYALGIDVHAAQIFTRRSIDRIAIDILYIDFEGRRLTEMKKWQLEGELRSVLSDEVAIDELLRRRSRPEASTPSDVGLQVLENASERETVLEIRADDTPGLLYYLTRRIADMGWNIHSARVATWGHEARDVFYVTDAPGNRPDSEQISRFAESICGQERTCGA